MSKDNGDEHQQSLTPPKNAAIIAALLDASAKEQKTARQIIALQIVFALICAGLAYGFQGAPQFALAVLSGGAVSVLNGILIAWRMARASLSSADDAQRQLRLLYFYAAERFLVVLTLLGLCIVVFKLSSLAMLGGFIVGQAVLLGGRLVLTGFKTEIATKNG
ncbi:MAG: ATP synthase subunit I [Gallionella sp.]|nr:ATP synthase subunit I [Gallionella sp.]